MKNLHCKLNQDIVRKSIEAMSWETLRIHLEQFVICEKIVTELSGYILRDKSILIKRKDASKKQKRDQFLQEIYTYIEQESNSTLKDMLQSKLSLLETIDKSYQKILKSLKKTTYAALPPELRVSSSLYMAARHFNEIMNLHFEKISAEKSFFVQGHSSIKDRQGRDVDIDAVISTIAENTCATLIMESYVNKWPPQESGIIKFPFNTNVTEDQILLANSNNHFATWWFMWQRTEERSRYFGDNISIKNIQDFLPDVKVHFPAGTTTIIEPSQLNELEKLAFIANERMKDRYQQFFMELMLETNVSKNIKGIDGYVGLPPVEYISEEEVHSCIMLSEVLQYNIADDVTEYLGLTLHEWVRGYGTLKELIKETYSSKPTDVNSLLLKIGKCDLRNLLSKVGLEKDKALAFIDNVSLTRSSRDMFDTPIVLLEDNNLLIFGPSVLTAATSNVVLSSLSNAGVQFKHKGKMFEQRFLSMLEKEKLNAKSVCKKIGGEEYQFDALVSWGDYIFLFECKNYSLPSLNTPSIYYYMLGLEDNLKQVTRLCGALKKHPEIIINNFGQDALAKKVIPCILYSQTFCTPCPINNIYISDASSVGRFFQSRHMNVKIFNNTKEISHKIEKIPLFSQWSGDMPTPEDLIHTLEFSFQYRLIEKQLSINHIIFPLDETTASWYSKRIRNNLDELEYINIIKELGLKAKESKLSRDN